MLILIFSSLTDIGNLDAFPYVICLVVTVLHSMVVFQHSTWLSILPLENKHEHILKQRLEMHTAFYTSL